MLNLSCDYTSPAIPEVLSALTSLTSQYPGYSEDDLCAQARTLIRSLCSAPDADVHFFVGGTQTNLTFISSLLRPHQGVLSAPSAHINVHETGAIESQGHKVLIIPDNNCQLGKLSAESIEASILAHKNDPNFEHTVQPGMVYISNPTEYGTIYSLAELTAISAVCRRYGIPLYLDGARLAYGLASPANTLSLPDLARLCDAFYIGGTKCGALFGEALVIANPALQSDFRYIIKQRGALLAKGFLLGAQFLALLPVVDRYAAHAVHEAQRIRSALIQSGIPLFVDSPTNQLFPILPPDSPLLLSLQRHFLLDPWPNSTWRITTDWSTRTSDIDHLISLIQHG